MSTLTRKQRKKDFDHIVHNILELDTEDRAYKLLMALTNNAKVSLSPVLNMSRNKLKAQKIVDPKGDSLSFDGWEITEIMNTRKYAVYQQEKQSKDFRLSTLNPSSFQDWKLTPDYRRIMHQDSFLNYDTTDVNIAIPSCYASSSTTQGGHADASSSNKIASTLLEEIETSFIDTHATINKEKMVTSTSIKKVDPSFIDPLHIKGG